MTDKQRIQTYKINLASPVAEAIERWARESCTNPKQYLQEIIEAHWAGKRMERIKAENISSPRVGQGSIRP